AQLSLLPEVLGKDLYPAGNAFRQVGIQFAQIVGFAAGGVLVAALTAPGALLVNGGTFLASAILVSVGVQRRPAAQDDQGQPEAGSQNAVEHRVRLAPVFFIVALTG